MLLTESRLTLLSLSSFYKHEFMKLLLQRSLSILYFKTQQHPYFSVIWFRYDLSPITVKYVERRKPLYHFITTVYTVLKQLE